MGCVVKEGGVFAAAAGLLDMMGSEYPPASQGVRFRTDREPSCFFASPAPPVAAIELAFSRDVTSILTDF